MQSANKTIVLGEASESDSEEISLNDEIQVDARDEELDSSHDSSSVPASAHDVNPNQTNSSASMVPTGSKKGYGASWLQFTDASSSLAKLATYTPYSLLSATMQTANSSKATEITSNPRQNLANSSSILHRTLYIKNQQLHACLDHAFKQPYTKASRDLNTISQRLVGVQRIMQEVEIGVANIKRERYNIDMKIDLIK